MPIALWRAVVLALVTTAAPFAAAAKKDDPLRAKLEAGVHYDSSVTVEETDVVTRRGAAAAQLGADLKFDVLPDKDDTVTVGYSLSQRLYRGDLSPYDRQVHTLSAGAGTKAGRTKIGADYSFHHLRLGGDPFLDMHAVSPYVSGFVTKNFHARGGYSFLDKNFETAKGRDARTHSLSATSFYFFNKLKSYFSLGGLVQTERAADPAFDFDGYRLDAKLKFPLAAVGREGKFIAGVAYGHRDYLHVTPAIDEKRREESLAYSLELEYPVTGPVNVVANYRYIDRDSNLPVANYTRYTFFVGVALTL